MKFHGHFLLVVLLCAPVFSVLLSCGKQSLSEPTAASQAKPIEVTTYDHKGLKIVHPVDWSFRYDNPGIYADRAVAFETNELSQIGVLFYKNYPRNIYEQADSFAQQFKLESSKNVKNYKRSEVEVGGYRGIELVWTSTRLSETRIELTILQVTGKPFPVYAHFHLFDDDIDFQNTKIITFLKGISFDPKGIEL